MVQAPELSPPTSFGPLTARESELLKRAGERVFALSRRLAERDREVEKLRAEVDSLRELLAENRNIREILSAQITSLQTEHEREYEERSELRRLVAALHLQLQEVIPMLVRQRTEDPPALAAPLQQHSERNKPRSKKNKSWADRMVTTAGHELKAIAKGARKKR